MTNFTTFLLLVTADIIKEEERVPGAMDNAKNMETGVQKRSVNPERELLEDGTRSRSTGRLFWC